MHQRSDPWSMVVIALTFVLFVTALFIKGFTHDMLLETGVFLVSVKLILMSHKNRIVAIETEERLEQIMPCCAINKIDDEIFGLHFCDGFKPASLPAA
jgi:hypothetical protein